MQFVKIKKNCRRLNFVKATPFPPPSLPQAYILQFKVACNQYCDEKVFPLGNFFLPSSCLYVYCCPKKKCSFKKKLIQK